MREKIRAKSLYQFFEVIQFLKLLNQIVRGQFSLGQSLQVIALGQYNTSPTSTGGVRENCVMANAISTGHLNNSLPSAPRRSSVTCDISTVRVTLLTKFIERHLSSVLRHRGP